MTAELPGMLQKGSENLAEFLQTWEIVDQSFHHQPVGQEVMKVSEGGLCQPLLSSTTGTPNKNENQKIEPKLSHRHVPHLILPLSHKNVIKCGRQREDMEKHGEHDQRAGTRELC